jgi:hypothetical protein
MLTKHDGFTSYGTIGHQSLNLMNQAWATMEHCFSVAAPGHNDKYTSAQGTRPIEGPRYAFNLLNKTPVDLLVIETAAKAWNLNKNPELRWEALVHNAKRDNWPQYVMENWLPQAQLRELGPSGKAAVTRWRELGYYTRVKFIDAQYYGGSIVLPQLMVVREHGLTGSKWRWAADPISLEPRPMSNLLTPKGLLPLRRKSGPVPPGDHPRVDRDPMPSKPGGWIETEEGPRQALLEETGRGLGISKPDLIFLTMEELRDTTSIFHWEYLSQCLMETTNASGTSATCSIASDSTWSTLETDEPKEETSPLTWRPPDLRPGQPWYNA